MTTKCGHRFGYMNVCQREKGHGGSHYCHPFQQPQQAGIPPLGTTPIKPDETPFEMPNGWDDKSECES